MLFNYLKIAFRNIIRHKAFSAINIAGLAIGMACSIFIFLWVQQELSYDRFHRNAKEIYRLTVSLGDMNAAVTPAVMPPELKSKIPAVKNFARLTTPRPHIFETGLKKFEEARTFYADSTFLSVFSFPLVTGNPANALDRPDAVVLTKAMAKKYFGAENPMGKTLRLDNKDNVTVTGVLDNIPVNSHLQFDFLLPISAIAQTDNDLKNGVWDDFNFFDYIVLDKSFTASAANISGLEKQVNEIYRKHVDEKYLKAFFHLQPLTAIHLHPGLLADLEGHGNIQYVNIFLIVALFILAVACINFMNLATARSARRAKEVGLRKVVGAGRGQLIAQFLGESILISFIALLIAAVLVPALMPLFNQLAGKALSLHIADGRLPFILLGIALFTGLVSGSYPALFLSGFRPAKVLKGDMKTMGNNRIFRNSLVVLQFVVSIVLLSGTVLVYKQLQYIRNMNLGFEKANLLYMVMKGDLYSKLDAFKTELKQNPLTSDFSLSEELPVNMANGTMSVDWEGKPPSSQTLFSVMSVNEDFFDVYQLKMLNGRHFSKEFRGDSSNYVINEKAARIMGMTIQNAVGKPLTQWGTKGVIVGVVKNFNFKPVQQSIDPLVLRLNRGGGIVTVRTKPGSTAATIKALEAINTKLNPAYPFSHGFVDQDLANMYKGEQQMGSLFNVFAILAIFISCLGLYGLSAFMAEQRTREIGVRKVLGASVAGVVYMLSTSFTRLILVAVLIAVPLAWYLINRWLEGFAYHVRIGWIVFPAASLAALVVAWLTISYESVKAALANPAGSLRSE